jgi:hypothetical protein
MKTPGGDVYWMNKRKEPRVALKLPLRLKGKDPSGAEFEESVVTENVSKSGAGLLIKQALRAGMSLTLCDSNRFTAHVRVTTVVRCEEDPHYFRVGVSFVDSAGLWVIK